MRESMLTEGVADDRPLNRVSSSRTYLLAIALCTFLLGLASAHAPVAGLLGAAGAGALCVLRQRTLAGVILVAMLLGLPFWQLAEVSFSYWTVLALLICASVLALRTTPSLLRVTDMAWSAFLVLGASSMVGLMLGPSQFASLFMIVGCLCGAFLGAGLARHLAMMDARILAWGEDGLGTVTRDLLLGRITSGMLHDLSQPLNVISMANGNLGYIVQRMPGDEREKRELLDRIARISSNTEIASSILSLFRWFGRESPEGDGASTVRTALLRAVSVTRSNVRHHGIEVALEGNALDYPVSAQHGRLEMMTVAALLSAFGAFASRNGPNRTGKILLDVNASPAHIIIRLYGQDKQGEQVVGRGLDNATLWLVEQVAREAGGDFRSRTHPGKQAQFTIRFARDDI